MARKPAPGRTVTASICRHNAGSTGSTTTVDVPIAAPQWTGTLDTLTVIFNASSAAVLPVEVILDRIDQPAERLVLEPLERTDRAGVAGLDAHERRVGIGQAPVDLEGGCQPQALGGGQVDMVVSR